MKFFIPGKKNAEEAEGLYKSIKNVVAQTMGSSIGDRRIRSISFTHEGKRGRATVGEEVIYPGALPEIVLAILESTVFLICTHNRGALPGSTPILVAPHELTHSEDFEPGP
jgi:hypothetical protein